MKAFRTETHISFVFPLVENFKNATAPSVPQPYYANGLRALHSRRPFISKTGYVGLAPWNVDVGDKICIFLGSSTTYLLREVTNMPDFHSLVGESFTHGVMYGEFMDEGSEIEIFKVR